MNTTGGTMPFKFKDVLCVFICVVILLLSPKNAFSSQYKSAKHVLDNGLTVIITEMPTNSFVSVYALTKAGSATEGKYLGSGISHFLEHMLFKGTETRGVGVISEAIQAVGGGINASTSFDYTIYTIDVPKEKFDVGLDIVSDMVMNSIFDPKEVEKEQEVIFGEMRLHNDNPDRRLSQLTFSNIYINHPYRHPVIGYKDLFAKITRDDLFDYYQTYYSPNNMVLSIAGGIKIDEVLGKVEKTFKDFKRRTPVDRNLPQEPQQITSRRYDDTYPTDLTRISIAYSSVNLLDPDLYALDVLAKILGDGESSRLYQELYKNKQLVYNINAYNYTPIDRGAFEISALLDDKNLEETLKEILNQVKQIRDKGVNTEELEKAKRQVLSDHVHALQTTSHVARSHAIDEAYAGDYRFSQKYVEAVKDVGMDDIKRVANHYLVEERRTIVSLRPESSQAKSDEASDQYNRVGDIEKIQLENGLIILIREDHSLPLVTLRAVFQGGARQEEEELAGLSTLMSEVWTKGSKSYTSEELAEISDSLGMSLGSFSGRNSFGLNISLLSEDLKTAFQIFEDLLKSPTFPQKEMDQIKENMKVALKQREDNISSYTSFRLKQLLFKNHPLRRDLNGTVESIDQITREDVKSFFDKFVTPSNMVITVFGDVDKEKVLAEVRSHFSQIKKKELALSQYNEKVIDQVLEEEYRLDKQQAMLLFGFFGPDFNSPDRYTIEVLSAVLGSSFSGRMFTNIRDKLGKAYTLGGSYVPGPDLGMVYFYVLTDEASVDKTKELLEKEIKDLQTTHLKDEELQNIKTYLKGGFKRGLQTSGQISLTSALDEVYGLGFDEYLKYDQYIDQVSKEDLLKAAQQYLNLQTMAVVITRPLDKKDKDE